MEFIDLLILGAITGVLITDFLPKLQGSMKAKKVGTLEKTLSPYISNKVRLLGHAMFAMVYYYVINSFDLLSPFTLAFVALLFLMGIVPQPNEVYTSGIRARGHFFSWEEIDEITGNRNNGLFKLRKKKGLTKTHNFTIATGDMKLFHKLLQKKPVKVTIK